MFQEIASFHFWQVRANMTMCEAAKELRKMNRRINKAEKVPTVRIQNSLPPSLLDDLKTHGQSLSTPWLGLLLGLVSPVQYCMRHSFINLENARWTEPTIVWPLMHMSSGTRKSCVYSFVQQFDPFLKDVIHDDDEETLTQSRDEDFLVGGVTFEKLGLIMNDAKCQAYWYFDEARMFLSQLGLYNKSPNASRDESILLSLYDARKWTHNTVKGTHFRLPITKLVIGGLTQTAHAMQLLKDDEKMNSGFLPRFLMFMLDAEWMDLDDLTDHDDSFRDKVLQMLSFVKQVHHHCGPGVNIQYRLYRSSLAYSEYHKFHRKITQWLKKNHNKQEIQHLATIMSKSLGQALRLSAILQAMFIAYNAEEVTSYEESVSANNEYEMRLLSSTGPISISLMAMKCSISLVLFSLTQYTILAGITCLEFDLDEDEDWLRDLDEQLHDQENSVDTSSDISPNCSSASLNALSSHSSSGNLPGPSNDPSTDPSHVPLSCFSSSSTAPLLQGDEIFHSRIGSVMTMGGRKLSKNYIIKNKKLDNKKAKCSNKANVLRLFNNLAMDGYGEINDDDDFIYHNNIVERVEQSPRKRQQLARYGVSLPKLKQCLELSPKVVLVQSKKVCKENISDNVNKDQDIFEDNVETR